MYFTLSRLLLTVLVFVAFCVVFACLLGLCGVKSVFTTCIHIIIQ